MIITRHGVERVSTADFAELVGTLLATTDVAAVTVFIGVVLASDGAGSIHGTLADFQTYLDTFAADICNFLVESAAQC
jgi:hypothetical protein